MASHRQMQLEKQKLLLEQRRKNRQQQSGRVTANQIGSRPSTGKHSRPSTGKNSRPSSSKSSISSGQSLTNNPSNSNAQLLYSDEESQPTATSNNRINDRTTPHTILVVGTAQVEQEEDKRHRSPVDFSSPEPQFSSDRELLIGTPIVSGEEEETVDENGEESPVHSKPQQQSRPVQNEVESAAVLNHTAHNHHNEEAAALAQEQMSQKLKKLGISSTLSYDTDESENSIEDVDLCSVATENTQTCEEPFAPILPISTETEKQQSPQKYTSTSEKEKVENPLGATIENRKILNLKETIFQPAPEGVTIKCHIRRDKRGIDKYMYPTYFLYLEWNEHTELFLLAARKIKRSRSSYYAISIDEEEISREGNGFTAKLRSNFVGSTYLTYDNGRKPASSLRNFASSHQLREELVLIQYETNLFGLKGPRKMNVVVPCMTANMERIRVQPKNSSETLLERLKAKDLTNLLQLHNKEPVWSDETFAYVLNFGGRVTEPSVKNFQLVHSSDVDYIILQFGRISDDMFTMDYSFPMCAVQAFAICLSSFDSKLACE